LQLAFRLSLPLFLLDPPLNLFDLVLQDPNLVIQLALDAVQSFQASAI